MPNTTNGYPYPATTDPVAQGATAIQSLASAADTKAGISATGKASPTFAASSSTATITATFPGGRFTAIPNVVACANNSLYFAATSAQTTTSVDITVRKWDNSAPGAGVAVQCTYLARSAT